MPKYRAGTRTHQQALRRLAGNDAPDGPIREGSALHRRLIPAQYRLGTAAYDAELDRRLEELEEGEPRQSGGPRPAENDTGMNVEVRDFDPDDGRFVITIAGDKAENGGALTLDVRGEDDEQILHGIWGFGSRKTAKVLAKDIAKDLDSDTVEAEADDQGNITVVVKSEARLASASARIEAEHGDT